MYTIQKVPAYYDPFWQNSYRDPIGKTIKKFKDKKTAIKYFKCLGNNDYLINIINKDNKSGYVYHLFSSNLNIQYNLLKRKTFIKA